MMIARQHEIKQFGKRLLKWFEVNKRDFPWRHTENPYEVLIAELLLQRTRAEKVVEVYNDFLQKYPKAAKLARANLNELEENITSLGLKKRAKILKNIGILLVEQFDGKVPDTEEALLKIHGVGYYIAYAVMCFAYGKNKAVVDWNVSRIMKRVWGHKIGSAPHSSKKFIEFAQNLMPRKEYKEYNWAVLDFAATVCKPRTPDCANCPITDLCVFYKKLNKK